MFLLGACVLLVEVARREKFDRLARISETGSSESGGLKYDL